MLSSAVRHFSNPDVYGAAIRAGNVELTEVGSRQFAASLIRIDLHQLWMQRFWESGPGIKHAALDPGRAAILFLTKAGPEVINHGVSMPATGIVRLSRAQHFYQRCFGSISLGSMSLPHDGVAGIAAATAGCDLSPPSDPLITTPQPSAMANLLRLHAAAGHLAQNAPQIIAHPHAAYGLEQSLILAMALCLRQGDIREETSAQRRHEAIMRRFHRVLEERPNQPIYIPELCARIGVTERTLRVCCQEHLGVSPKRFLLLRRMHLSRRDLRTADPAATTVTEIATRYGFWELGRFAVEYRSLYGEAPSATLHRAPE